MVEHNQCFLPAVILWSPFVVYSHILDANCQKCATCGLPLSMSAWTDGSSADTQPRSLYGIDGPVLLVSAIYTCGSQHRTLAHDASILGKFPSQDVIPFVLFHRSGFTHQLMSLCMSMVYRGMTFLEIETFLLQRKWEVHAREQEFDSVQKSITIRDVNTHEMLPDSELLKTPSDTLIRKCFLAHFLVNEKIYAREMYHINVGETISFDHTFKVAANIGYQREDKVWIPLYDSLFIAMNSDGKVVSWQLTKGTSISQIEQCLYSINCRARDKGLPITSVYVDDCCKLRNKIQSIFGSQTAVKLDIFHATQRITKTLSKRHNKFQSCIADLQLVFREDGDSGTRRSFNTPASHVILRKLEAFDEKWRNVANQDNKKVFSTETTRAIANLKQHIIHGCLSDIPPGCGTNRNERFHCHMNSLIRRSRIGVLLAYALLSVVMYSHNSAMKIKGKTLVRPIIASPERYVRDNVHLPSFGICSKVRDQVREADSFETDVHDCEIDLDLVRSLYTASLNMYYISKSLLTLNLSRLKESVIRFEPFQCQNVDDPVIISSRDTVTHGKLSEYGLRVCETAKDGNCFFMSVAVSLSCAKELGRQACTILGSPLDVLEDPVEFSKFLRRRFVEELLSDHRQEYTAFLVHEQLVHWEQEVRKFLQDGFFNNAIGDLLPTVISNVLHLNIIIFQRLISPPVMFVSPRELNNSIGTIFLVYDPSHQGHYDAALKCVEEQKRNESGKSNKDTFCCSCGVNSSIEGKKSCKSQPLYASRCSCYKNSVSCSLACRCKNCDNPHGSRPPPGERKRTRRHHLLQDSHVPTAKKFAQERNEALTSSIWSDFETIVLSVVAKNEQVSDYPAIKKVYNDIVYYSSATFCIDPLTPNIIFRNKSLPQVEAKLHYMNARQ